MENRVYHMFGLAKHKILVFSVIINFFFVSSCNEKTEKISSFEINGETQGTTYSVIIVDDEIKVDKADFDSIFKKFDNSLSTYISNSVISKLNIGIGRIRIIDESGFFQRCYQLSQLVYSETNGLFDPSVFPLVKGWGFMNDIESPLSQQEVDSILNFVSFKPDFLHSIKFESNHIELNKKHSNFKLDFNAIAQGLSVDVIDEFLEKKGYSDYYIEVGGELIVRGHNREGEDWRIGIDSPEENLTQRELENVLSLSDKAVATSGNYRKFYEVEGVKYSHTLSPETGFPVRHSLLSSTVVANDAGSADAYATAFMVMGVDETLKFVETHPNENIEVYLLYADDKGAIKRKMSKNFSKYLDK